jgi:Sec-independent protein translocase protein TatA
MFFGPRKLPQLSRSIGKSLAEFRKASEDFKRTWEREVELESARIQEGVNNALSMNDETTTISAVPAEQVIARDSFSSEGYGNEPSESSEPADVQGAESLSKRDWL